FELRIGQIELEIGGEAAELKRQVGDEPLVANDMETYLRGVSDPPRDVDRPFRAVPQQPPVAVNQRHARNAELAPAILVVDEVCTRDHHVSRVPNDVHDLVDAAEQILRKVV